MSKHIAGDMLWRVRDNTLFIVKEVIHDKIYVLMNPLNIDKNDDIQFVNVHLIDECDTPLFNNCIDTSKQPAVGTLMWKGDKCLRVISVTYNAPIKPYDPKGPCNSCYNRKCEQCAYGYRPHDSVMKEYNELYNPRTRYTIHLACEDNSKRDYTLKQCFEELSLIPYNISELTKKVLSYEYSGENKTRYDDIVKKVESDMIKDDEADVIDGFENNSKVQNEDIDMKNSYGGYVKTLTEAIEDTEKDSYQKWKESLHVVNVLKFDMKYFIRKKAYYIKRHQGVQLEADALLMSVSEDELEFLRIEGGKTVDFQVSELVKIPIKEYLNGIWTIKRLWGEE